VNLQSFIIKNCVPLISEKIILLVDFAIKFRYQSCESCLAQ